MKKNIILMTIAIMIVIIIVFSAFILLLKPLQQQTIDYHVKVDNYVGFNIGTDKMYFGTLAPGAFGERRTVLCTDKEVFVVITTTGEAGEWIRPEDQHLILEEDSCKELRFNMKVPRNTSLGNYTGTVDFTMYTPLAQYLI